MSHQFKPGDLALIVSSSKGTSPNIGMAVELVIKLRTNDCFNLPDGSRAVNKGPECWMVEAPGLSAMTLQAVHIDLGGISLVQERYLMPLRGDFTPEQQKAKEVPA
ncbi:hypothetical protein KHO49_16520 [Pseudomonas sp. RC4D1]|uniref:hypothetical protein n=1 Tax=Pseudomonas sp. RC4D1 TaxID=2834407 RepID=UPI001BCF7940|nr:hypothetical protein [Pseudomonas sp. RC4D1]MBS7559948.1 hypothetical protein [Pseudomonas sp. RC4D1]